MSRFQQRLKNFLPRAKALAKSPEFDEFDDETAEALAVVSEDETLAKWLDTYFRRSSPLESGNTFASAYHDMRSSLLQERNREVRRAAEEAGIPWTRFLALLPKLIELILLLGIGQQRKELVDSINAGSAGVEPVADEEESEGAAEGEAAGDSPDPNDVNEATAATRTRKKSTKKT